MEIQKYDYSHAKLCIALYYVLHSSMVVLPQRYVVQDQRPARRTNQHHQSTTHLRRNVTD